MQMSVTIKDIAKLAGVSPSTVSRVCNNSPSISRETRERVQKLITELGYELPAVQDAASGPPVRHIGVILPPSGRETYENTFYLKAIRGISQICNQRCAAISIVTGMDYEEILATVQKLHHSGGISGFILLYSLPNDIVVDYLCSNGLIYVIVGKSDDISYQTVCVDNDNLSAGRDAATYLYGLGHRRIGYIGSKRPFLYASDRRAGYQLSLFLHSLPVREDYLIEMESIHSQDFHALEALLRREDRPTAFVVSDDLLALALERACAQMGLSIPDDISIIAFNNSLYSQLASPQLTVVDINSYQLGQESANRILSWIDNPELPATRVIVPYRIVERSSCRKI